jgi:hypothetical protein
LPAYAQIKYNSVDTPKVIAAVMAHPLINSINWVLPLTKLLLLTAVLMPLLSSKFSGRILIGYYVLILLVVSILQNMSFTKDYGFVWLISNTLVEFVVLAFCFYDVVMNRTIIVKENLNKNRLWVVALMLLSFLMPYAVNSKNVVYPALSLNIFLNEAGVTYCMITPVIIGMLLLFSKGVYKPTLSIVSYVGFIFGLLNMMTWFIMQPENWWMGVLHLPLLILSFAGLLVTRKEKTT